MVGNGTAGSLAAAKATASFRLGIWRVASQLLDDHDATEAVILAVRRLYGPSAAARVSRDDWAEFTSDLLVAATFGVISHPWPLLRVRHRLGGLLENDLEDLVADAWRTLDYEQQQAICDRVLAHCRRSLSGVTEW